MDDAPLPNGCPRGSRFWPAFGLGFATGAVISAVLGRRAVQLARKRFTMLVRHRGRMENPALIVNPGSGDGKAQRVGLVEAAEQAGIRVIVLRRGDDLTDLAHRAVNDGADALGMAGGDGSLGLVAGVAVDRGVPFFCVPVGTRNHFAIDVGLDRDDPLAALQSVIDGDEIKVDYSRAGGRVFLNNISIGVYAQAVHTDDYRDRRADALLEKALESRVDPDTLARVNLTTPDGVAHDRVSLLMVSNNPYVMSGPPDFGRREVMDSGQLGVMAVTPTMSGGQRREATPDVTEWSTDSLTLTGPETILTGLDGEALQFDPPLEITNHRRGLRLLVPRGVRPGYVAPSKRIAARVLDLTALGGADR